MPLSRQGINIAFIGTDNRALTACAEYLSRHRDFKRMDLDEPLLTFVRRTIGYGSKKKLDRKSLRELYDSVYKWDNDIFINAFKRNFEMSEGDVVVPGVRYLNELETLRDLGFIIIRVTSDKTDQPNLTSQLKTADKGTVLLSMFYDKSFVRRFQSQYSIRFTTIAQRGEIIDAVLKDIGYNLTYPNASE